MLTTFVEQWIDFFRRSTVLHKRNKVLIKKKDLTDDIELLDHQPLSKVIEYFIDQQNKCTKEYPDYEHIITIEPYGYDGAFEIVLNIFQEESDEEYEARIKAIELQQQKAEAKKLEKERKIYEQLKKKFGE